jgi:5-methylcytosine-specific restriction protein A
MNRKQFIESQGATCSNWNWSWSFVNESKRFVIFGLWSHHSGSNEGLVLSRDWEKKASGKRNPGFKQSEEHARLVVEDGFYLLTFPMFAKLDEQGNIPEDGPVKIDRVQPILQRKFLVELGRGWYAVDTPLPPANSFQPLIGTVFEEGEQSMLLSKHVERSPAAKKRCLDVHGYQCFVCEKSMSDRYGTIGEGVIDVHHLQELAQRDGKHIVDPEKDLVPVCPNCHRMIHTKRPALSLQAVRNMLTKHC